jgi:hypothetical protein
MTTADETGALTKDALRDMAASTRHTPLDGYQHRTILTAFRIFDALESLGATNYAAHLKTSSIEFTWTVYDVCLTIDVNINGRIDVSGVATVGDPRANITIARQAIFGAIAIAEYNEMLEWLSATAEDTQTPPDRAVLREP